MTATVAIAGATGFIGRPLAERLRARFDVVALSRGGRPDEPASAGQGALRWRRCDLFSLLDAEQALAGADVLVYLVHSMMPSARLTQGHFRDLDLVAADNAGRAAARAGVRQIVYLGGLLPAGGGALSEHLASRLEVEEALAAHGVPVTALRAGLVLGPGGSSSRLLLDLVRRLPVMACPAWTATPAQPIALSDVLALLGYVVDRPGTFGQVYDVGGPEVVSYRGLMEAAARELGLRRGFVGVPLLSPRLSRLWVRLVTGAPTELVAPLIESLRHPMVCRDRRLQEAAGVPGATVAEALREALAAGGGEEEAPRAFRGRRRGEAVVRSVQRLPLPAGRDAAWVAEEYLRWLPRFLRPLVAVRAGEDGARSLHVRPLRAPLLVLAPAPDRSSPDRALLYVRGGLLAREGGRGRLELREVAGGRAVLAALHDYRPRLWWPVYLATQARLHLVVMRAFGRHLARAGA